MNAKSAEDQNEPAWSKLLGKVHCGDAVEILPTWPSEFVDTVVTSPPYFAQRDYQDDRQIGREAHPDEFLERLVNVFMEVHRVLKSTGSAWIVMGDKYLDGRLLGTPWRLALALQDRGWWLRSDVIWHKPNAMPSPVSNRPTTDHEYVFFLTKNSDYYYSADAIREPHVTFSAESKMRGGRKHLGVRGGTPEKGKNKGQSNLHDGRWDQAFHPKGRNKRTVWSIPLSKFRGAHFAVFPEKLVETCISATCPEAGIVLDPFSGSGTTLVVADRLKRQALGVDCVKDYCKIANDRLAMARKKKSSTLFDLDND